MDLEVIVRRAAELEVPKVKNAPIPPPMTFVLESVGDTAWAKPTTAAAQGG